MIAPQAEESHGDLDKTRRNNLRGHVQFAAVWWTKCLNGWNDGTSGALLPRMQAVYHVNFVVVSLIFVMACLGFVVGALINVPLLDRIGFGKVLVIGAFCQVVVYALQSAALPFPAFVVTFAINGVGIALQDAQVTSYVASLKDHPDIKMMILQAAYGAGALTAPLVATQFSQMAHWSYFYLVSLGIAVTNLIVLWSVFRLKPLEACFAQIGQLPEEHHRDTGRSGHNKMRQFLGMKTVHMLAAFALVYVGTEVTIGGWIVTFIEQVRGGGASSGYISSGFFGGLMLGRLGLVWVNQKLGDRISLYLYSCIAIGLELVVWFVPSLIGGAVAVSLVGFVLGPMYPILMNHTGRILPRWLLSGSIGWIAGLGQAGSALFPFMTGAVANKAGIESLQPMLLGFLGLMIGLWTLVPKDVRRPD
ncbi:MFS general substrate transporter [Guyanagaster necrorhizus]|uniref:MFS general substrate transporter n=1 Tax=Guyanagaster necrorhizus TaxID=856835 RepID=A0A9P7VMS9_9AGAR|nr:MFS general substrate transporter [Guyanagaster necrorhizus MCA 3950]KAG7444073.1 MFS general substrate transporter [Guyanagaster necrorhizus MCA 3950]